MNSRIAVVPGSFDPPTLGHLDVIRRAASLYDQLHVLVVHNPGKTALLPIAKRVSLIQEAVAEARITGNVIVTSWSVGLLVDYATDVGASVLVNLSNLAWFGQTWALRQHLQIGRLRSIETARPMVTSTNTGITASIDPKGRVVAALPPHRPGVLSATVQGMSGLTPYDRYGDQPVLLLVGIVLAALVRRPTPR